MLQLPPPAIVRICSHLRLKGAQEANNKRVLCVCQYISLVEHLVHLQVEEAQGGGAMGGRGTRVGGVWVGGVQVGEA